MITLIQGRVTFEMVADEMRQAQDRLNHWDEPVTKMNMIMAQHIDTNFEAEGRPPFTKRTRPYPWKILQKTGLMRRRVLLAARHARVRKLSQRVVISYAEMFIATRYVRFHLEGTRFMVPRPFMPPYTQFTTTEQSSIDQAVIDHIGLGA